MSEPESVQDPALRIKPIELKRGQDLWVLNGFVRKMRESCDLARASKRMGALQSLNPIQLTPKVRACNHHETVSGLLKAGLEEL
jgi:hypothetical protein